MTRGGWIDPALYIGDLNYNDAVTRYEIGKSIPIFDPDSREYLGSVSKRGEYNKRRSYNGHKYTELVKPDGVRYKLDDGPTFWSLASLLAYVDENVMVITILGQKVYRRTLTGGTHHYQFEWNGKTFYTEEAVRASIRANVPAKVESDAEIDRLFKRMDRQHSALTAQFYDLEKRVGSPKPDSKGAQALERVNALAKDVGRIKGNSDAYKESRESPEVRAEMARFERVQMEKARVQANIITAVVMVGCGVAATIALLLTLQAIAVGVAIVGGVTLLKTWIDRPDYADFIENKWTEVTAQNQINQKAMKELTSGYQFGETSTDGGS